ncbi:hypothetical protein SFC76_11020 [Sphingomonas sp. CD22]|uniref:hypothetical protein n=1 Tax=Sphingomonas sp. CD22 TaxID=3100214 RepID=UPI002AE03BBD|nr:hypothetical protein [Sphingomonas sp. CD22]MEA1084792.1 hypothetical protein [Sphingomonas sp. CD22]
MVAVVSVLVFSGAFLVAVGVIAATVAPQWQRIVRLAAGHIEPAFAPLSQLASAERRIAVRRWASAPVPAGVRRLRAAA